MALQLRAAVIGAALASLTLSDACLAQALPQVYGSRPSYGPASVDVPPNTVAIGQMFWVPELDSGFDPQGIAVSGTDVLISGYFSTDSANRGACRVTRLDTRTGRKTGHVDIPQPCGHAGGVALAPGEVMYVADTRHLFEVPLSAFDDPGSTKLKILSLEPGLTGALAASGPGEIWLGTYDEKAPGRLFRFSAAQLRGLSNGQMLMRHMASWELSGPSYAQGAAVAGNGEIWVSSSDLEWGVVDRVNLATGETVARYNVAPGTEGIAFDQLGRLWAVSEAGARHVYDQPFRSWVLPFFPVLYSMDVTRLR